MTNDYFNTNCVAGTTNNNCNAIADYIKILNDVDACGKRNSGQINEVFLWGGPWFGYWESNLAGPNAFWYNSSPTTGTTCTKLLPIMGFNYEREEARMFEDFGHRTESTMKRVFGSWAADYNITSAVASTGWDKFSILDNQSPGNGGCGNAHTAFNSPLVSGQYDWTSTRTAKSSCRDFANYPNLIGQTEDLNCSVWGCTDLGYYENWFFKFLPHNTGSNNGIQNNWWNYIIDPQQFVL